MTGDDDDDDVDNNNNNNIIIIIIIIIITLKLRAIQFSDKQKTVSTHIQPANARAKWCIIDQLQI